MDNNNSNSTRKYYDANSFMINGRLTRDPEIRTAPNGNNYAIISIANNRGETTNFFTFFAGSSQIPFVNACLRKGCAVDVSGTILPQVETAPDGKKTTVYRLIANKFALIANPRNSSATGVQSVSQTTERPMTPPTQPTYTTPSNPSNPAPTRAPQSANYQQNNSYSYTSQTTQAYNNTSFDDDLPF